MKKTKTEPILVPGTPTVDGMVLSVKGDRVRLLLDSHEVVVRNPTYVIPLASPKPPPPYKSHYKFEWQGSPPVQFSFDCSEGRVYGYLRKSRTQEDLAFSAVDIYWASAIGRDYPIESLRYREGFPEINILASDIVATYGRWLYYRCRGNLKSISELQEQADKPTIVVEYLEIGAMINCLDRLKQDLRRTKTERTVILNDSYPSVRVRGLPPSETQTMLETTSPKLTREDAKDLITQLRSTKDSSQARKIRAQLRKLGIKGGLRGQPSDR